MRNAFLKNILILFLLSFVCQSQAFGQLKSEDLPNRDGVKLGDFIRLHSAFKTEEQLDTNIFLDNTDRKFDAITVLSPSVGIEIPLQDNSMSFDYELGMFLYGTYHDQNHVDHRARGLIEINLSDYRITAKDTFRIFTSRAADEDSLRLKRENNEFRVGVDAQFELLGFDVGYTNKIEAYASKDIEIAQLTYEDRDRMYNIVDATLSYRFLPKTLLLVENDIGFIHYYNSSQPPDSYFDEALLGIKGEWFSKMNVNFKAGFRYQKYDKSDVISDKYYAGPVMRGGFDYHPTDDDVIAVDLVKTVYESTYSTMNYYDANLISAAYRHNFNDKISSKVEGLYQINLYPSQTTENGVTAKRYDNFFGGSLSLRYDMRKWISFVAKYEYRQRVSRFDIFDYVDNVISLNGTIGF